jgi:diguanylate cyclase (GGDEF)-like protein/PAS domain S-box-containing protein
MPELARRDETRVSGGPDHGPAITGGWGWLALLRLGLSVTMGVYALAYEPIETHPGPGYLLPVALLLAAVPAALALAQVTTRLRASRAMALAAVPVDVAVVFATLALYAFDPRSYLLALVVVVQAEAGAVLGIRRGLVAWLVTSGGYIAIENLSREVSGAEVEPAEIGLRLGVGLILALGGGFLSEELSGERRRRLAEREGKIQSLEEAEARYRSLVEQIPAVAYMGSGGADSPPTYISPQVEALTGFPPEQWTASSGFWASRIHPEDRERVMTESARAAATGAPFKEEYRLMAKDGGVLWVRDEATMVHDDLGRPLFRQGVLVDITEQKRAEEQISFLAYHDNLTELPNRVMFESLLDLAIARARRANRAIAVLYMDLDDFKEVNDTLGHPSGDELLRDMAGRLRRAVREADVVARQGGDEFLVLLADLEREDAGGLPGPEGTARIVADRVHASLRRPFVLGGSEVSVTASIGIAVFPAVAQDAAELLKQADAAMYQSKRQAPGRSAVFTG